MGNVNNFLLQVVFKAGLVLSVISCGKNIERYSGVKSIVNDKSTVSSLSGEYTDLNGNIINLEQLNSKTQVIIFAQDLCAVCSEEAFELSDYVKKNGLPSVFEIRHILVESFIDDAKDWVQSHQVQWSVGIGSFEVFKNYCSSMQVPCLIIFKPNVGITFQHTGKLSAEQITREAGGW